MKNLIGNPFEVVLKGSDRVVKGILVETDDDFDYVQDSGGVCIVPKPNVLYYRTNELSKQSKVIRNDVQLVGAPQDKTMNVVIDGQVVAAITVPADIEAKELMTFVYSQGVVKETLAGHKQKAVECFEDAVYITTDQVSAVERNPMTSYLAPSEMIKRFEGIKGGKGA
jgi:hypothetical protein